MPLLRITHQRHAITQAQKVQLAEELTRAILVGETGADNAAARSVACVIFQEVDAATSWFTGGKIETNPPKGGRLIFDVVYPYGAADQETKTRLHSEINGIVSRVLGVDGTFPNRIGDWVLIHEITEGNWGVSGNTMSVRDIHGAMQGDPKRVPFFEAALKAQRKVLEQFGFPAGAAGWGKKG